MPKNLQIMLIVMSLLVFLFVLRKIRKSQLQIQNAIIWIIGSIALLVISVFDDIMMYIATNLGFISTSNFVLVSVIFFLLLIVFHQDIKISIIEEKLKDLNHYIALKDYQARNEDKDEKRHD